MEHSVCNQSTSGASHLHSVKTLSATNFAKLENSRSNRIILFIHVQSLVKVGKISKTDCSHNSYHSIYEGQLRKPVFITCHLQFCYNLCPQMLFWSKWCPRNVIVMYLRPFNCYGDVCYGIFGKASGVL